MKEINPEELKVVVVNSQDWIDKQLGKIKPYKTQLEAWRTASKAKKSNQLYLLYGEQLEYFKKWQQQRDLLTQDDFNFLNDSQIFWDKAKNSLPHGCDYVAVIEAMNFWTGGDKIFNDYLFEIAKLPKISDLTRGNEEQWVEYLVQSHLVQKWKNNEIADKIIIDHLNQISDRLTENSNVDSFWLLYSYRQVLRSKKIGIEYNLEQEELKSIGLVVEKNGQITLLNKIYQSIFNQSWVEGKLVSIRPYYGRKFLTWTDSNFEDKSQLLQGENLQKVLNLVRHKQELRELEVEFLINSLVWEIWQYDLNSYLNSELQITKAVAVEIIEEFKPKIETKTSNVYLVIQEILRWTRFDLLLLKNLCQVIGDAETDITFGKEAEWVGNIVRSHFIENSTIEEVNNHFNSIKEALTHNKNVDSFWLLMSYRQIIQEGIITFDVSKEQKELLKQKLVIIKDNKLEVTNKIYGSVFNQDSMLAELRKNERSHAEKLFAWIDKNYSEESELLSDYEESEPPKIDKSIQANPEQRSFSDKVVGSLITIIVIGVIWNFVNFSQTNISQNPPIDSALKSSNDGILTDQECTKYLDKIINAKSAENQVLPTIKYFAELIHNNQVETLSDLCDNSLEKQYHSLLKDYFNTITSSSAFYTLKEYNGVDIACMMPEDFLIKERTITQILQGWYTNKIGKDGQTKIPTEKEFPEDNLSPIEYVRSQINKGYQENNCPAAQFLEVSQDGN